MAISAEQLNIILTAKDKQFTRAMERNQRRVERFAGRSQKSLSKTSASFNALGAAAKRLGPAIAAAFSVQAINSSINAAAEIAKLSSLAGIASDEFQILAATSAQFGIGQEKLADILKDVNDKFGDFTETGAGPLKDFFEFIAPQVGLTADAFADLSSDQKLGAYVSALEKANVSQSEMTFYMEAIANDSTALAAAFQNNGAAIDQMRIRAEKLGFVLDEELIANAQEAKGELDLMSRVISANLSNALINLAPLLVGTAQGIAGLTAGVSTFISQFNQLRDVGLQQFARTNSYLDGLIAQAEEAGIALEEVNALRREMAIRAGMGSEGHVFSETFSEQESRIDAATTALEKALSIMSERGELLEIEIPSGFQESLEAALAAGTAQTEQLKEQVRLRGLSAEQAERERIEVEKQALIADLMRSFEGQAFTAEATEGREKVMALAEEFERAAIAASSILSPVDGISSGTSGAASAAADLAEQLRIVGEMSPVLTSLGLDAEKLEGIMGTVENSMEDAFMSMVDGTASASDAFKSMAAEIIKELYRVLVVKRITGFITDAIGGFFGVSSAGPSPIGQASGGPVKAGQPYTVGEHGREMFVPQSAGRILSVPQAKDAISGGGGGGSVQVVYQFQGGVTEADLGRALPLLVERTKREVVDAVQRGGSVARVFR